MEETQGNPEIGMKGDSLEEVESIQQTTDSGSEAFFNDLENQVNGGIVDPEVTQSQKSGPEQVTHAESDDGSNRSGEQSKDGTDWEKRYKDSNA